MRRFFLLPILLLSALANGQSYDAPGTDPTWSQLQPNAYANLKQNNGIYPASAPNRTEYYPVYTDATGTDRSVTATWNLVNDGLTFSGRCNMPVDYLTGAVRAHAKGITGAGVKIVLIGDGYSNSAAHDAIGAIAGGTGSTTYMHDAQVIGVMACKATGTSKLVGTCYGASIYSRAITDIAGDIDYARGIGAKIIVLSSFIGEVTDAQRVAVKAFVRSGGVMIVAVGNGGTLAPMQPICGLPGVVSVGSTVGGTVLSFQDAWYSRKIQPVNGKGIDFALPARTLGVAYNNIDGEGVTTTGTDHSTYINLSGTSFTAPQVAGLFALCMQRFPRLSGRMIYYMIKRNARAVTIEGYTVYIPNLSFIR